VELLKRSGVEIAWERTGDGPALLLTHGFMATSHMWEPNLKALSADHTVIRWDMRGHGRTDYPEDPNAYSPEIYTDDMVALLDAAEVERATLIGMSLGGYLSLECYVRHPERVAGLVLVDTGPGFKRDEPREAWNELTEGRAVGFEAKGLDHLDYSRTEIAEGTHRDASGLILSARHVLKQHDDRVIQSLPNVAVPTLVVVGELDERFLAGCSYMASRVPGAEHVIVPDAGHASNMDQPAAFDAAVISFLERNAL
jgi:pimeloyl-ACP methyl ester carboxylesterase